MKIKNRESGLDLIRCLALLFVITYHFFLYNKYSSTDQTGVAMWLAGCSRWLSTSCVGLFLMLTGYLKSNRTDFRSCYRGLVPVLLTYLLACAICIPVRHFLFRDPVSIVTWIKRIFTFDAVFYGWYVEMYIGLVLLMPFVNMTMKYLQDKKALLAFAAVLLFITALPGAIPWPVFPDFWRQLYPLTYYVLGAIVYRLQPKIKPWIGILCAVLMSVLLGTVTVLSTDATLSDALTWQYPDLWIVFIVVCLFVSLYRLNIPTRFRQILAFAASGCFGGYLLTYLFDAWCYLPLRHWKTPDRYWLLYICVSIPNYILSLLLGCLLQKICDKILSLRKAAMKVKAE